MRKFLFFVFFSVATLIAEATHIRAGEITYRWLTGYTYEVTIVIYSKTSSAIEDAVLNDVRWGDGKIETIGKTSEITYPGINTSKRSYVRQHTYPGPGKYTISLTHFNRNQGIQNIGNSVEAAFYLETELIANPFSPVGTNAINNSPVLHNPPLDDACLFAVFEHNPAAHDPDGDELKYQLVASRGENGQPLVYQFPNEVNPGADNQISIDPVTGDLVWDAPQKAGEYNIAILIEEWRNGIKVGSMIRDMQINVTTCVNKPPIIEVLPDVCIEAGKLYKDSISASDPNPAQKVVLSALGGPFAIANNPAVFTSGGAANPVTGVIEWQTACSNVRKSAYQVNIKATDSTTKPLVDYESFFITVIGPAPQNPGAIPLGNSILISWDRSVCSNVIGYDIYRRNSYYGYFPSQCETGVPDYTGYRKIARVDGQSTNSYLDTNIVFGSEFCYMIVAIFPDGAESYASREICTLARRDIPQIIKVSVGRTNASKGLDTLAWVYPSELDTVTRYKGPYYYQVFRDSGFVEAVTPIYTTPISNSLYQTDTVFLDSNINTVAYPHTYRVEVFSDNVMVGSSSSASSVYLTIQSNDRINRLSWNYEVPWANDTSRVYRLNNTTGLYEQIGLLPGDTVFSDTSVTNGVQYCYYVVTSGSYKNPSIKRPLLNHSQEVCAMPVDKTPPCLSGFTVIPSCSTETARLEWDTAITFCNADLKSYNLYYSPTETEPLALVKTFPRTTNSYVFNQNGSIAGCYEITATDSVGNETPLYRKACIDNCPSYRLPNVFSPNDDNVNDLFHPFPYQFISSVDAKIYNRWGKLVFETTDPDINWDGKAGGKPVADGVYFYVVVVKKLTLRGIVEETINGTVTVFTQLKDAK